MSWHRHIITRCMFLILFNVVGQTENKYRSGYIYPEGSSGTQKHTPGAQTQTISVQIHIYTHTHTYSHPALPAGRHIITPVSKVLQLALRRRVPPTPGSPNSLSFTPPLCLSPPSMLILLSPILSLSLGHSLASRAWLPMLYICHWSETCEARLPLHSPTVIQKGPRQPGIRT